MRPAFIGVCGTDFHIYKGARWTLLGSRNANAADFAFVMSCMNADRIPTALLHTHTAALADAAETIPTWLAQPDVVVKAMIKVTV